MLNHISSPQNAKIKDTVRLRDRRGRERTGLTVVDGMREIDRAIQSGLQIVDLFVLDHPHSTTHSHDTLLSHLIASAHTQNASVSTVSERVFQKIAYGDRNEHAVAVFAIPNPSLDRLQLNSEPLVGIIEGIEKPGNIGAVIRSADGAGVDALICVDCVTDLYNPNVIRASLGTLFALPVCQATADETLAWLAKNQFEVLVARVDGAKPYDQVRYAGPTAIVLGSEANGVTPAWHNQKFHGIQLPMRGIADSLNISATAAILFYEATRQRKHRSPDA